AQAPDFTYSCQASTEHFEQCATVPAYRSLAIGRRYISLNHGRLKPRLVCSISPSRSCCDWSLRLRADVTGLRPNQPIYSLLLEYVRGPSGHAPHREDIGETVARNLERLEQERRIELDIRVETPPGPVLREQRERLRLHGFGKADAVFSA